MGNIIFLDIDGVLNTRKHLVRQKRETGSMSSLNWSPIACRHLTLLCEQFDARIVISSTWRYNHPMDELRGFCEDNDISGKLVIDITPSLIHEERRETYNRGDEIAGWLKSNTYNKYVILDDLPKAAFRESQYPHLVQCQQDKGFAEKKLAVRAGEILGE